jgi:hypothetical protein
MGARYKKPVGGFVPTKQAFLGMTNHTELDLRGGNLYRVVRFRESKL